MYKQIHSRILEEEDALIAFRRELHRHPELQWQEYQTTEKIAAALDAIGIHYLRTEPTGIIAEITGGSSGKTIALRADMDALPVEELNDIAYKSTEAGKMHACGHDAHTAMLLTAAKVLYEAKDTLEGNVRLIFQPSEENGEGAKVMIEQGAMKDVDQVFGIHIWSPAPAGKVICHKGPAFAAADILEIIFTGKGGHGAMPHETVDAAIIASDFVQNVQTIVSRKIDPLEPAVITIGKMEVGTQYNVIAEKAVLQGTVRCFEPRLRDQVEEAIRHYANQTAALYGGTAEIHYRRGPAPVINDDDSAAFVQEVIRKTFGEETLLTAKPTTVGEDFSYYQLEAMGSFALVGTGNPAKETTFAHHHGRFNVDEDTLKIGAELYAQVAAHFLNEK